MSIELVGALGIHRVYRLLFMQCECGLSSHDRNTTLFRISFKVFPAAQDTHFAGGPEALSAADRRILAGVAGVVGHTSFCSIHPPIRTPLGNLARYWLRTSWQHD